MIPNPVAQGTCDLVDPFSSGISTSLPNVWRLDYLGNVIIGNPVIVSMVSSAVKCRYCQRRNDAHNLICDGCGAPLDD